MKIIKLDCVDSTNEWCKQNDSGEDVAVVAEYQTFGKGTKGRTFDSGRGGIYVSVMRHYTNFKAVNAFKILVNSCVAVCETVKEFGVYPTIRWSNDVLTNDKKISGTLIENTFHGENISRSIVGIGLNVNNEIIPSLRDIATSIKEVNGYRVDKNAVFLKLVQNLQNEYNINDYKSYMPWLGGNILIKTNGGEKEAKALNVEEDGRLVCEINGKIKKIFSAEVSIRF